MNMSFISSSEANNACFMSGKDSPDFGGPALPFISSGSLPMGVWWTKTTKDGKGLSIIYIFG